METFCILFNNKREYSIIVDTLLNRLQGEKPIIIIDLFFSVSYNLNILPIGVKIYSF
jgi:hypothetical protein